MRNNSATFFIILVLYMAAAFSSITLFSAFLLHAGQIVAVNLSYVHVGVSDSLR